MRVQLLGSLVRKLSKYTFLAHISSSAPSMAGVGEASLVLGILSSIISIIDATKQLYEAVEDEVSLSFQKVGDEAPSYLKAPRRCRKVC